MNVLSNTKCYIQPTRQGERDILFSFLYLSYIVPFQGNLRICNYEFFLIILICFPTEPVRISALSEIEFETSNKLDDYYRCFHLLGNVMPYRTLRDFYFKP